MRHIIKIFSSFGLSCSLLLMLGLLTWLGTLEQVEHGLFEVQKKYFESFYLFHEFRTPFETSDGESLRFSVPLPGVNLVLCILAVNLVLGGMVRMRRHKGTYGVLVTHFGIAFLLLAGFVKMYFSQDGHVTLYEGDRSEHFESYYRWELVVTEDLGGGKVREHLVPQEAFMHAADANAVRVNSSDLPFSLEVRHFMRNSRLMPKGPMFEVDVPVVDRLFLQEEPLALEAEQNVAGAYVTVVGDVENTEAIVWGLEQAPLTVEFGGNRYGVGLRHERYPMPFAVQLDEFTKIDHARSTMPKSFSSDVTVIENSSERQVEISMNEPLRDQGLVLYQASWGPSNARPGDKLFSTLSVVRNPADQYPLYSCIIIAIGLLMHFSRKLLRFIRTEARTT